MAVEVEKPYLNKKYVAIYLFINILVLMYFYVTMFEIIQIEHT